MLSLNQCISMLFVLSAFATGASAASKSDLYCSVYPNSAFADQVCARNKNTNQCTVSWHFSNDNSAKSKQREAMDSCQRYLGNVVSNWSPEDYYCAVSPNASFPREVCAVSKSTGQCTQSWPFKNDDISKSKQRFAMDRCERFLGHIVSHWDPANYYCDLWPNAAFPQQVCARSKKTGQCTHSWPFKNDNSTKSKQKAAFEKCERFLN